MLIIIAIIITGAAAGYLLRRVLPMRYIDQAANIVIMLLLLSLGIATGADKQIVSRFATLGLDALLIAVGGTLGSALLALAVYKRITYLKKKNGDDEAPAS